MLVRQSACRSEACAAANGQRELVLTGFAEKGPWIRRFVGPVGPVGLAGLVGLVGRVPLYCKKYDFLPQSGNEIKNSQLIAEFTGIFKGSSSVCDRSLRKIR